jgi:oxygen-dependent protoporphyrinogen oxidase
VSGVQGTPRVNNDLVIVGAGIAGLAAAYEFRHRQFTVAVVERRPRPGGLILTERIGDYLIDAGPDSFLTLKPAALELCRELGLSERLISTRPPRTAFVLRGGRLVAIPEGSVLGFPLSPRAILSNPLFSIAGRIRVALEPFVRPRRPDAGDESIGAFIRRRFGHEASAVIGHALLAGIHAGDADRLSVRALFPRLVEAEAEHGSVLRAFRRGCQGSARPQVSGIHGTPRANNDTFRALAGGTGELVTRLVEALDASLRYGAGVRDVALAPVGARPHYQITMDDGERIEARALMLAVPMFEIAQLMRSFDPTLAEQCAEIAYASSATVVLAYPRAAVRHALNGTGFVVPPDERCEILAATWVSSKWAGRAPADRVLLRAFVGGARREAQMQLDDEALAQLAQRELASILGIASSPEFAKVYRWERGTPQYAVGHLERVEAIDARTARWPGLFLTGSGLRGIGIPDTIADARATARHAAAFLERERGKVGG